MENQERQQGSFFRFEELRVYHKALDYYQWAKTQVKDFCELDYQTIGKPLLESAADIVINIAEGSARQKAQFVVFLKDAKTSLRECVVRTAMAHKGGVITDEQLNASSEYMEEMTRMLGAMINSLSPHTSKIRRNEQQETEFEDSVNPNPNFEY
ncbi:MAG: four helix bundle protein [Bacteroidales bacterium]|jgi:four helix bundle protein|nr:four helix bundle protein [Bacteroidales bacterium]